MDRYLLGPLLSSFRKGGKVIFYEVYSKTWKKKNIYYGSEFSGRVGQPRFPMDAFLSSYYENDR